MNSYSATQSAASYRSSPQLIQFALCDIKPLDVNHYGWRQYFAAFKNCDAIPLFDLPTNIRIHGIVRCNSSFLTHLI
jgi:hypothetical protein